MESNRTNVVLILQQFFLLQIQLFLKYLSGKKTLPSKEEMLKETNEEMKTRWKNGLTKKQAHMMGVDLLVIENALSSCYIS